MKDSTKGWLVIAAIVALVWWRGYTPSPDPGPPPSPGSEFQAVIIYESQSNKSLTLDPAIRTYLDERCEKDSEGNTMWRWWDDDLEEEDLRFAPASLVALYQRAKRDADELPWAALNVDSRVVSEALPRKTGDALRFLQEAGGVLQPQ